MTREEILKQSEQLYGLVFDFVRDMPDAVLEQYWSTFTWVLSDTKLSGREKILVAFGAAAALHCQY